MRNEAGEFVFLKVKPGSYGIVVYTPLSWFAMPKDKDNKELLIFDVKAGQTVDLGTLTIP